MLPQKPVSDFSGLTSSAFLELGQQVGNIFEIVLKVGVDENQNVARNHGRASTIPHEFLA
jgi:hypothetical protein